MMLGEQQPPRGVGESEAPELAGQEILLKQLLPNPQRQRHGEAAVTARRKREIRLQQPLELQERLLVEDHVIDVGCPEARVLQAEPDSLRREARIVAPPGESLLLRGGHDATVDDERGGTVVVVGG
jgi:hypothetical protein